MKSKKIIILALLMVFSFNVLTFAANGIDVTLEEVGPASLEIGKNVPYMLNVNFTEPVNNFNNLFVTVRLDDGYDFVDAKLEGVQGKTGSFEVYSKPNAQGQYKFITLRLTDIKDLDGVSNFSVGIELKVNNKAKLGEPLTNRVNVNFQTQSQIKENNSEAHYYEFDSVTKIKVGENKQIVQPEENKPKPEENKLPVEENIKPDPIQNGNLLIKTGGIYSHFMTNFEGKTDPGNKVEVQYLDKIDNIEVNNNGSFIVSIPIGLESDIKIFAKDTAGNILASKILKYVDESNVSVDQINEAIDSMRKFDFESIIERELATFKRYSDKTSFVLGLEDGTVQDKYKLFENLYYKTRTEIKEKTQVHKPFMSGYPEGNFLPKNSITRAEVATIFSKLLAGGEVGKKTSKFSDVESWEWYSKYIAHVTEAGLMKGYPEGNFLPKNKITRAEFASIVARYRKLEKSDLFVFPDLPLDHWALDDIMKVATAGYMKGYPDKTFGPQLHVTRAEAATTINRVLGRIPDKESIDRNNLAKFNDIKSHWAYYQIVEATTEHNYIMEAGLEKYR